MHYVCDLPLLNCVFLFKERRLSKVLHKRDNNRFCVLTTTRVEDAASSLRFYYICLSMGWEFVKWTRELEVNSVYK